jgi:hypothetical protein
MGSTGPTGPSPTGSNIIVNTQTSNAIITCTSNNDIFQGNSSLTWNGVRLYMDTPNFIIGQGSVSSGSNSISIGNSICKNDTICIGVTTYASSASVVIGGSSGKLGMSGNYNAIIGYYSGRGLTSGGGNVFIGGNTAQQITTGNDNTLIGISAGTSQTTQSQNTVCGYYSNCSNGIATFTNCSVYGANIRDGIISGNNQVQLGNSSTTVYCYGAVQDRSDIRDKADIRNTILGLNFIEKLRPVDFKWDYREDYIISSLDENMNSVITTLPKDGSKKRNRYHHGLIAQELKEIIDEMGVDFGGYQNHAINNGSDRVSLGYNELIAPIIKSIQELSERIKNLENKL